jgi:hypothetical protein
MKMKIGKKQFDVEHDCYIMGILNYTPDSFSDGGKWNNRDRALRHVADMIEEGAAIIDIGGESTRPGHVQISAQEEIERVVPMIELVKKQFDIPVSVDSYKGEVVEAALKAGADLVNDIWGFLYDKRVAELTAAYDVPCCLMHNRHEAVYQDFWTDFLSDMKHCLEAAKQAGVKEENIILDPGIGFAKSPEQNLALIHHLDRLKALGFPVLLGTSRKSTLGYVLDLPVDQRVEATLTTTVFGVQQGASFIRVHDVKENLRAMRMTQGILREGKRNG